MRAGIMLESYAGTHSDHVKAAGRHLGAFFTTERDAAAYQP